MTSAVDSIKIIQLFYFSDPIPLSFLVSAFLESTISSESYSSPHPYPTGVRVASQVYFPGAQYLLVQFDPRSRTSEFSFLMFSKHSSGQNDLGFWTGSFPTKPVVIPAQAFVWSFFSNDTTQVKKKLN
jgi:hypothetical protein